MNKSLALAMLYDDAVINEHKIYTASFVTHTEFGCQNCQEGGHLHGNKLVFDKKCTKEFNTP